MTDFTRYKCVVEYDGTGFAGWQRQKDQPTIQGCIEDAIKKFTGDEHSDVFVAGRTDAGVHAYGQVIHFNIRKEKALEPNKIMGAINHHIKPNNIAIISCENADDSFHARFSATKRHYEYLIINRSAPCIIDKNRVWHIPMPLNVEAMQEAANILIGKHDFSSFRDSECQAKSPVKTIDQIDFSADKNSDKIVVNISAPSFLHHMVRIIMGTLKMVGEGKWTKADIEKILEAKDRKLAGPTAPACGLYLTKVDY